MLLLALVRVRVRVRFLAAEWLLLLRLRLLEAGVRADRAEPPPRYLRRYVGIVDWEWRVERWEIEHEKRTKGGCTVTTYFLFVGPVRTIKYVPPFAHF